MDTQQLFSPSTAVAMRKAMTLHQQDSRKSVRETKSRDLTAERSKKNAKVLTRKRFCCNKDMEVLESDKIWFVRCWCFQNLTLLRDTP